MFRYLSIFAGTLLALLWLLQTVLLNEFYKSTKINELKTMAASIEQNLEQDTIVSYLTQLSMKYDVCIVVATGGGLPLFSSEVNIGCPVEQIQEYQLKQYIIQALAHHGSYLQEVKTMKTTNINGFSFYELDQQATLKGILYTKLATANNQTYAIVLNANIIPVDATVRTIRIQLLMVTVLMIGFALFLAYFFSKKLANPIMQLSAASKKLADGDYGVPFNASGYQEVVELSDSLNYAARELGKVDAMQKELIANISHDLRTPLTMITGYAELMRDLPGENTAENIQTVIDEAKRLTSLVNDVLDISKFQHGTPALQCSKCDLTALLHDIVERYSKLLAKEAYQILFHYDAHVFVEADEIKLTQVIYNLINNAITYTSEQKQIEVRQIVQDGQVQIAIIDYGEGIAEDKLALIWDRYYKLDHQHRRPHLGSGLGLSIVKQILELHQAQFGVTSVLGKGSTFWFSLPVIPESNT